MILHKYRPQKIDLLRKNQPDLLDTLQAVFPNADPFILGHMAGLIIEYVIQSKGNVDIFNSDPEFPDVDDY